VALWSIQLLTSRVVIDPEAAPSDVVVVERVRFRVLGLDLAGPADRKAGGRNSGPGRHGIPGEIDGRIDAR